MKVVRILQKVETPRLIVPACLFVEYHKEIDKFLLVDNLGFILPQEDFEALAKEMALTYEEASEEIREYNQERARELTPGDSRRPGFVYLLSSSSGLHKIGQSIDPGRRLKTIRSKKPHEQIEIVHTFLVDDMDAAESSLHLRYRSKCHHSEWFNLESIDIAFICSITSYQEGKFNNESFN